MKKIKFLCVILLMFLLQGCYDSRDVKNVAIVMGVAVDIDDKGNYKTKTQVVLPEGLTKDGGGDTFENYSGSGTHFAQCMEKTALSCGKFMYLSHATSLLISEEIAKKDIYETLDFFMRDNELRANLLIAVAEKDIDKILKTESKLLKVPLSSVASLGRRLGETSLGQTITVFDFVSDMKKKNKAIIAPVISEEEEKITVDSSAVFKNGKMIGKFSNAETRGALWLTDKIENAIITVPFDEVSVDMKIRKTKEEIKPIYNNENVIFQAAVNCNVSILRDDGDVLNAYGSEKIIEAVNYAVKKEILDTFEKMQTIDADVYGFEDLIYRKKPKIWERLNKDAGEIFKNIKLKVTVNTKIEEVGNIIRSAGMRGGI